MKHFVIGTAGHVDHGKTVLVKALTGIETDRLKEEKERGISIELGFAPFQLPSGILAGLVDVPGHERFIKNMLAGVGGLDMVLLVIAADEGIMPQTREHLEIIDLLQVQEGIIVITKAEMAEDDWIDLVREEIKELVQGTVLEGVPITEVSAVTGKGIPELIGLIDAIAGRLRERPVTGQARMPIDRVFTMTGFGTVVTGTLVEGRLNIGDTVEILPQNSEARVRGLQVHGSKVETAEAGQRVAANLAGIEHDEVNRGSVLAAPGVLKPSHRLDIRIKLLPSVGKPIANRTRVRIHLGTSEILARIILLEGEEIDPGGSAFAQLECEEPAVAARGDRLVIRSYSPMHTIGGGIVIDPAPGKHKRFDSGAIDVLQTKERGSPEELVRQYMEAAGKIAFSGDELRKGPGLDENLVAASIGKMVSESLLKEFKVDNKVYYILTAMFETKAAQLTAQLTGYHRQFPLRPGISKEEVRNKLFTAMNNKVFNALLDLYRLAEVVAVTGESIASQGFVPAPGAGHEQTFAAIEDRYLKGEFQTPGWDEIAAEFKLKQAESEEILNYFVNKRVLIKLEDNIVLHRQNVDKARELVTNFLSQHGEMSLGEARDLLRTSRKFALPIMDYLDKERVTRRVDDKRVLY